jgi:4a-hydroxytetrahydrobiopterin dehydratase
MILGEHDIEKVLQELPDWTLKEGKLKARFTFPDFKTAFRFMALIAHEAETLNHHPEWTNTYNKVDVLLVTHDVGSRITLRDVALARIMSDAAQTFRK